MSIQNNVLGPLPAQSGTDPYGALKHFDVLKTLGHGHFSVDRLFCSKSFYRGSCCFEKS